MRVLSCLLAVTLVLVGTAVHAQTTVTFNATGTGMSGSVQSFVVPPGVTSLSIDASGAEGGGGVGGLGAQIQGDFTVTPGETLSIIVGQQGQTTAQPGYPFAGGGGGASFVYRNATDAFPLVSAAGGGGSAEGCGASVAGGDGSATAGPTPGAGTGSGAGGAGGNGGAGGSNTGSYSTGGGGGGWLTHGQDGLTLRNPNGKGGEAPRNGAMGGEFTHNSPGFDAGEAGNGGFGGGGGMADNTGAGGGGGGFNGGGGGNNYSGSCPNRWGAGGGGGSYNGGTNQVNTSGVGTGDGLVDITYGAVIPAVPRWGLLLLVLLIAGSGCLFLSRFQSIL